MICCLWVCFWGSFWVVALSCFCPFFLALCCSCWCWFSLFVFFLPPSLSSPFSCWCGGVGGVLLKRSSWCDLRSWFAGACSWWMLLRVCAGGVCPSVWMIKRPFFVGLGCWCLGCWWSCSAVLPVLLSALNHSYTAVLFLWWWLFGCPFLSCGSCGFF